MRAQNFRPSGSPAFTLIELLVVISIISLLIAVLLPALGEARTVTRKVICSSNQRQAFLAISLYANDMDGFYPMVIRTFNNSYAAFDENAGTNGTYFHFARPGDPVRTYFTNSDMLLCPDRDQDLNPANGYGQHPTLKDYHYLSTTNFIIAGSGSYGGTSRAWYGRQIKNNSEPDDIYTNVIPNVDFAGRKFSNYADVNPPLYPRLWINKPSEQPAFVEPSPDDDNEWDSYNARRVDMSHDDGGNVFFIDGHGRWAPTSESIQRMVTPGLTNDPMW